MNLNEKKLACVVVEFFGNFFLDNPDEIKNLSIHIQNNLDSLIEFIADKELVDLNMDEVRLIDCAIDNCISSIEKLLTFSVEINSCESTFTITTYYSGYVEYTHGLEQNSSPCSCGYRTHTVCLVCGSIQQGLNCDCDD